MDAIGLKPGMVVAEIGAGTGRMTVWLADRVGIKGHDYSHFFLVYQKRPHGNNQLMWLFQDPDYYSYRSESIGLAAATLIDWKLTVIRAINKVNPAGIKNIQSSILVR